jgi:hypothetical protein
MQILLFIALSIAFAIILHRSSHGLLVPSLLAGLGAAVTFHVVGFLVEGAFDSLVLISMVTTTIVGSLIALAFGWLMRSSGKKRGRQAGI